MFGVLNNTLSEFPLFSFEYLNANALAIPFRKTCIKTSVVSLLTQNYYNNLEVVRIHLYLF